MINSFRYLEEEQGAYGKKKTLITFLKNHLIKNKIDHRN